MRNNAVNVFIIDDEFPRIPEFRESGVYNSAISMDNLYHLAVNSEWNHHLGYLQQLIKDLYTNDVRIQGYVNLLGFSTPTQALSEIKAGVNLPQVIIYDWEYLNAPAYTTNSSDWLLEILKATEAFVFIYSNLVNNKEANIAKILNAPLFNSYASHFQVFLKGGQFKSSFSAEEFILQYIIGEATERGEIRINGIKIEFTKNRFLKNASDILYLQRILGNEYVLDELGKIKFRVDELTVQKILNDSGGYLLYNEDKGILINPKSEVTYEELQPLMEMSYSEIIEKFSLEILEDAIERGFLVL